MILQEIVAYKRKEVAFAKAQRSVAELSRLVRGRHAGHRFRTALADSGKPLALIAELKRKSPSAGMLRERFDPVRLAQELQEAGASALSILTDEHFFGGSLDILRDVQPFVEIPILRKDFILDPYQIYEAVHASADAVLLIVRILTPAQLRELLELADQLGVDALTEVHSEEELELALKAGASLIGINHRNLQTFTTDPTLTARLVPKIPDSTLIVAESGIRRREELQAFAALGVHAVLIGETLMRSADVGATIRELFAGIW